MKNVMKLLLFFLVILVSFPLCESAAQAPSVACTMEAKICPDGSSVARTGPNCEFAPCPSGNSIGPSIIHPDKYESQEYPDKPLRFIPAGILSVKFILEHRSALNEKTVSVKGRVLSTFLDEDACPSHTSMCAQPRITLGTQNKKDNYIITVLLPEQSKKHYEIDEIVEISGVVMAGANTVTLRVP